MTPPPPPPAAPDLDTLLRALALLPTGVIISDLTQPGTPIIYANAAAHALGGLPDASLVGQPVAVLAGHESPPDVAARVRDAVHGHRGFHEELGYRRPDGSAVWVDAEVRVEHDAAGRPLRFVSCHTDVTTKKLAELALRASERRFALALEAGQLGIWDFDPVAGRLEFGGAWHNTLGRLYGRQPTDYETWAAMIHPDDRPRLRELYDAHLAGRSEFFDAEFRLRTAAGAYRWMRARGKVVERAADGTEVRVSGTHQDVTDRRESQQSLQRVMQTSPCSIFVFDLRERRATYTNHSVGEALGYSPEEVEAMGDAVLARTTHPDDLPKVMEFTRGWHDAADGEVRTFEYRARRKDGRERTLLVRGMVFDRGPDGAPTQVVGASLDVTDQRAAAEEKLRLDEQLRETQRLESLGVLAGGIAHDFNNLLTGVLGYADAAEKELGPAHPAHGHLAAIAASAHRAADLCRQMLAYAGKGRVEVGVVNLSAVVREARGLLGLAISKKAEVEFDLADDLPGVECDVNQVRQVVMNLFTNASEALQDWPGRIRVATQAVAVQRSDLDAYRFGPERDPGRYVRLTVSDTGCGMNPATLGRMFDPFFTTKFTGRGLGLSAVLGIIRSHGGAIRVNSAEGKGTTVSVLLPASPEPAPAAAAKPAAAAVRGTGRVLVVDDEPTVRKLTGMFLEGFGFTPVYAADGAEAVRLYGEHRDDLALVLLDLTMPGLDGLEVFRAIRGQGGRTPVVLMSGYSEHEVREKFGGLGFQSFLSKPFTRDDLARRLAEVGGGP